MPPRSFPAKATFAQPSFPRRREPIPRRVRHHEPKSPQPSFPRGACPREVGGREPVPGTVRHGPKSPQPSFPRGPAPEKSGVGNPSPARFVTMGPSPHNRRSREEPAPYSDTGQEPIHRSVRHHGRRKPPQPSFPRRACPVLRYGAGTHPRQGASPRTLQVPPTVVPEKSLPRTPIRGGNPSPQGSLPCTLQVARRPIQPNEAVNLGE